MKKIFKELEKALLLPVIVLIYFYQKVLSPFFQPSCRFYPSCSQYSLQAIKNYGFYGIFYMIYRLFRCNSFSKGGFDPLPQKKNKCRTNKTSNLTTIING